MIRPYHTTDLERLLTVWYAATSLAHPFMDAAFLEKEKANIRNIYIPNTQTWVYLQAGQVEGFISMKDHEIGAIFVHPDKQGQGIGRQLLDIVRPLHDELEVQVFKENRIARPFYDRYGFRVIKEYIHEETQQTMLIMKLS